MIRKVYEVDPLLCPHCGGQMSIIAFIEAVWKAECELVLLPGYNTSGGAPAKYSAFVSHLRLFCKIDFYRSFLLPL